MKKIISILLFMFLFTPYVLAQDNSNIKTSATNLDDNFDTKIKLSINKYDVDTKIVDIVFVVDASSFSDDLVDSIYNFINNMNSHSSINGNYSIVAFGNGSVKVMDLTSGDKINSKEYLTNLVTSNSEINSIAGITNVQSGLLMSKEILDSSTTGSKKENRNVILITDGAAFTYNNSNGETSSTIYGLSSTLYLDMGNMDSNGDVGNPSRETKIVKYYNETSDYASAFEKLLKEDIKYYADRGYKWGEKDADEIHSLQSENKITIYTSPSQVNDLDSYPYTNMEIGTYSAAKVLESIKEEKYNIYTIGYLYQWGFDNNGNVENRLLGLPSICFLSWTKNVGKLYLEKTKSISLNRFDEIYTDIETSILPEIDKPEYLITEMGYGNYEDGTNYDFEFVNNIDNIDILVNGEKLDKREIAVNTYAFGMDSSLEKEYRYILTYYPSGNLDNKNEHFRLDLYNNESIEVVYHEKLTEKCIKQEAGNYGTYDEFGIKNYDRLKVNNLTNLYFTSGKFIDFSTPTVSYDIIDKQVKGATEVNPNTNDKLNKNIVIFIFSLMTLIMLMLINKKIKKYS